MERTLFPTEQVDLCGEGDDVLVALPSRGTAYRVNAAGAVIAEEMQRPVLVSAIEQRLRDEFDVDRRGCSETVDAFVNRLHALDMVEIFEDDRAPLRRRYLDLLKRALVNLVYPEHEMRIEALETSAPAADRLAHERRMRDIRYLEPETFASIVQHKREGWNWKRMPARFSHTMIGLRRLDNLDYCAAHVFANGIPGDFLEAGVLQGGASIFLRALQIAYGQPQRRTWVADSFAGLPAASHQNDDVFGSDFTEARQPWLASTLTAVQDNFRTYGLLSDEVRFLEGWFADTLARSPVEQLAILRIDADLYASTSDVLVSLYDRVSPGGFIIVDDYNAFEPCRKAVDAFRASRGDDALLRRIDWTGVYWQKRL